MGFYVQLRYEIVGQVDSFEERDVIDAELHLIAAKNRLELRDLERYTYDEDKND